MNEIGPSDFSGLPSEDKKRYLTISHEMTKFARDHAIPITFAPPVRTFASPLSGGKIATFTLPLSLGKIDGATGCVLRHESRVFIVTAEHVLNEYEKRLDDGEILNWQVGKLRPFDPRPRVAWRGRWKHRPKDIVFLEISEREANEACEGQTHILSAPTAWPPPAPKVGQSVLLAGYPNELREIANGVIRPGSFSAMVRVTTQTGDGTFKCRFEYSELLSFNEQPVPLKELRANVGGLSGGPVFCVGNISYPLVGVITEHGGSFADYDTIVIEGVEGVSSRFPI